MSPLPKRSSTKRKGQQKHPRKTLSSWWTFFQRWLPRPMTLGTRGEHVAEKYLQTLGYRPVAKNLRNRTGEIDLLMLAPDARTLVLIEVKARQLGPEEEIKNPRPEVHVNQHKQRKITALAHQLVQRYGYADHLIRFDVVGVDFPRQGRPIVRHHPGAFEAAW